MYWGTFLIGKHKILWIIYFISIKQLTSVHRASSIYQSTLILYKLNDYLADERSGYIAREGIHVYNYYHYVRVLF